MSSTNPFSQNLSWHKIAESPADLALGPNGMGEVEVAGKRICVALFQDKIFACASRCPHAGAVLAHGFVDQLGHLVCPLHRYRFTLERGYNSSGEGYYLKTHPVEQREDGIYVGLERGGLMSWLK